MAEAPTQTQQPRPIINVVFHLGGGGADAGNKPGAAPASKASIEAMPKIKVKESGRDCSICLEEFGVDEEAREMPCKHVFHSGCIQKWLQIHGSCPICRFLMPADTVETGGGDGGRRSSEDAEVTGLEFLHMLLSFASQTILIGVGRGSHQPGSNPVDDDDTSSN
ncbi:putative Ribosomal protein L34e superfamily protein [Hibiscus syriacus]|uniref:RING-type E3 ubiquitin transferase n=1 Tax=Hibiscus syriacus TaxID=106335 RepID=A0A6A2ZT57_HIBSY|nr:E3 ubiquitin-protein ligase RING1-like [Hibiscus syriacus]KAE8694449.1 putative Ribosomal protein L34e superfamily protein [Hibiscus syriacus]